ncbi:MAG: single-stranded-DNA-specific exonuclease RecJ [Gammaproteobacteria bacterium]|nr:single-stranded-DNA-specific exonuclease RecJ [Gammaproteobacteria bacterium]
MKLEIMRRPLSGDGRALGAGLHPVLQRVYAARGLHDPAELRLTLDRLLPVGTLAGVEAAADLLARHRHGSRVLIVGDFDADGATSTALMVRALRGFGFEDVDFLVPNRFEFGYGLTPQIVELAAARTPGLLVTVDNGISSNAGVAAARACGIDVLVTDHHLPGSELPAAHVIVNPNLPDSRFPSRALAGVGVAFYVLAALARRLVAEGSMPPGAPALAGWLDLVALGTVADVVPLDANNRILVAQGLARIRAGRAVPGIRALLAIAARDPATLTAGDLGFAVAPRLNAAGRLADMALGIRCLLADESSVALELAGELDRLNTERRGIESRMQAQALAAVRVLSDPLSAERRAGVCLFDPGWHQGVVGLVASRVKERLRRPVIAFAAVDALVLRGSARSVPGVHIRDVLDALATADPQLIQKFGGHAMAAGLSLERARLDAFARAFDAEVARWLARAGAPDVVETDGELAAEEIALPTAQALRAGGPWGAGFPEPLFDGIFEVRACRILAERHLKLTVMAPEGRGGFDAIAFNAIDPGAPGPLPAGRVRLVYRLDANSFQGEARLQLVVDHLLPA